MLPTCPTEVSFQGSCLQNPLSLWFHLTIYSTAFMLLGYLQSSLWNYGLRVSLPRAVVEGLLLGEWEFRLKRGAIPNRYKALSRAVEGYSVGERVYFLNWEVEVCRGSDRRRLLFHQFPPESAERRGCFDQGDDVPGGYRLQEVFWVFLLAKKSVYKWQ